MLISAYFLIIAIPSAMIGLPSIPFLSAIVSSLVPPPLISEWRIGGFVFAAASLNGGLFIFAISNQMGFSFPAKSLILSSSSSSSCQLLDKRSTNSFKYGIVIEFERNGGLLIIFPASPTNSTINDQVAVNVSAFNQIGKYSTSFSTIPTTSITTPTSSPTLW